MGSGYAVYVGTAGNGALYDTLAPFLLELLNVSSSTLPKGVEVTERWQSDTGLRFVLNHSDQTQRVTARGRDLLTDTDVDGDVNLPPKGVLVIQTDVT